MSTTRQLAAIVFADIEGYTALMQRDEAKAMLLRNKFQESLEKEINARNGRIAVFNGDGALCVFNSAIEAVRAAMSIQEIMQYEPVVPLRIGIHIGDVISDGKNVFGDGVNVASRIETFAVPNSIFMSSKVADEIKNHSGIESISLGKFALKNVDEPVEIFAIKAEKLIVPKKDLLEGKGKRTQKKKSPTKKILVIASILLALIIITFFSYRSYISRSTAVDAAPHNKTVGVLPFANLSSQKEDEYFADGICDEVLTQLSKVSALNVLSRTSTLKFRDSKKTIKEIGAEIGADILLEGSVQKSNGKVRINVQLIDAITDKHLWANTYDREMKDVFAIQSEIANQIAETLNTTLTENEQNIIAEKPTENLEAYDLYLRGNKLSEDFWKYNRMENVDEAVRLYEQAIKLDPKFLEPYNELVSINVEISFRKPVTNYEQYRIISKEWLDKMISLKIDRPIVHLAIAIYKYEGARDYEGSLAELDLVDQYYRNDKQTIGLRCYVLRRMGRLLEAQKLFLRLADLYPKSFGNIMDVADTYGILRNADSAIYYCNKAIELKRDNADFYISKSIFYLKFKGDLRQAEEVLKMANPFIDSVAFRNVRNELAMLRGDYDRADNYLSNKPDSFYELSQSNAITNAQMIAIMLNNEGKKQEAKTNFQKSLDILSIQVQLHPEDFRLHAAIGVAYAGLGNKQKALDEISRARNIMTTSDDAIIGLAPLESLALVNTLLGDQDAAIDMLQELLNRPCGWDLTNTIPLYKMHPYWKLLQNNPRFQKMVQ